MRPLPSVLILLVTLAVYPLKADVKLPAIFGDHMVLQRYTKVPVWGWADPNETITVSAGSVRASGTAAADGKWSVNLIDLKPSDQPIDLVVVGKNTVTFHDVLVGDVWVCSGQSNMEFSFGGTHNAAEEQPRANLPMLRRFIVSRKMAYEPQSDCVGNWVVTTPDTVRGFSGVGYFFGREILKEQKVPVGMISTYWGGTSAELWTSLEALKSNPLLRQKADLFEEHKAKLPELKKQYETEIFPAWQKAHDAWMHEGGDIFTKDYAKWKEASFQARNADQPVPPEPQPPKPEPKKPQAPDAESLPTILNNGMIAPIIPYAIKGVIWYQGEANGGNPKLYETLFPVMITDWRTRWGEGDFPFLWVQLANFRPRNPDPTQTIDGWPGLREAQSKTLKLPNTGQAVIIDIGLPNDIHPKDKMDVGIRLALAARHVAYGEDLVYSGPTYDSLKVEGTAIRVKFKNIGSGLVIGAAPSIKLGVPPAKPLDKLKGFAIAGEDRKFVWATAEIEGESVVVSSPEVKEPKAVRYGWAMNPEVNLYNKENLPASPFRTDDWDGAPPAKH